MNQFWQNFIEILKIVFSSWPIIFLICVLFFKKELSNFLSEVGEISTKWISFRRYKKFHIEGIEVIKETYQKIVRTYFALGSLINPLQYPSENKTYDEMIEEKYKIFINEVNELLKYFRENRIFFNENLALKIDKLGEEFRKVLNKWDYARAIKNVDKWHEAWNDFQTDTENIKSDIEKEFRNIIGIE
jgi:hypothetical protein